jgi:hypothetical protein
MEFKVRNSYSGKYKELIVAIDGEKFEMGLPNDFDRVEMAKELVAAACDLLNYEDDNREKLIDILDELNRYK